MIPLISNLKPYLALLRESRHIIIICMATTVSMLGQGIIVPVLPLFAREFSMEATMIGFVVGIYGFSRLFLNLPSGLISEKFGQKRLMGIGLLLSALGIILIGFADSIMEIALGRFISGGGSAMFITGSMTFVSNMSTLENRGRLLSLQTGSLLLGNDIGPILGGIFADILGYRWPFYIGGAITVIAAMTVFVRLPATQRPLLASSEDDILPKGKRRSWNWDIRAIGNLLSNPTFLLVNLFAMLVFFTRAGSRSTIMPLIAVEKASMSATGIGLLFVVLTTINLLMVLPSGILADRFGRKAVILPGAFITFIGLIFFSISGNASFMFLAVMVWGLGTGIIGPIPAVFAGDLAPPGKAGITMGLYRTFGDIGFVAGPVFLGWIADVVDHHFGRGLGGSVAMEVNAVLLLLLALILTFMGKETAGKAKKP